MRFKTSRAPVKKLPGATLSPTGNGLPAVESRSWRQKPGNDWPDGLALQVIGQSKEVAATNLSGHWGNVFMAALQRAHHIAQFLPAPQTEHARRHMHTIPTLQ
jgi:hypothetical protein